MPLRSRRSLRASLAVGVGLGLLACVLAGSLFIVGRIENLQRSQAEERLTRQATAFARLVGKQSEALTDVSVSSELRAISDAHVYFVGQGGLDLGIEFPTL